MSHRQLVDEITSQVLTTLGTKALGDRDDVLRRLKEWKSEVSLVDQQLQRLSRQTSRSFPEASAAVAQAVTHLTRALRELRLAQDSLELYE